MKNNIFILGLLVIFASCKTTQIPKLPIEHKPAKCGAVCMDQNQLHLDSIKNVQETVLNMTINFNFMGQNAINETLIDENISELNKAFGSQFHFQKGAISSHFKFKHTLTDLYTNYVEDGKLIQITRDSFNQNNVINVFLLKTIPDSTNGNVLLGFTPIFTQGFENYENSSPDLDQTFISYQGLERKTTLIHELGHFFSLAHPWQLTFAQQKLAGLGTDEAICTNYMNYNCFINQFTHQQLNQMYLFTKKYRSYLVNPME